eukprot:TRINITY_DN5456_c0_g1_i2.p1 TRINITY_DN5456_c0_g1~~TRINITY_DN5456_c0_g1_i2.p1  ORF type:complete len:225 (-),score=27.25 TRINITY_DN5456_c0_g1_i2:470-1144(-)
MARYILPALLASVATSAEPEKHDLKGHPYLQEPWNATFRIALKGDNGGEEKSFSVGVHPEWAPLGAQRFQDMVQGNVLHAARFFRVVPGFMAQFGIPADAKEAAKWENMPIKDDPVKEKNKRGRISFGTAGPNTRTTQIFINFVDNTFLDGMGFSPFAEVLDDGMSIVDKIESKYGESPDQGQILSKGNAYLDEKFPGLSSVTDLMSPALSSIGVSHSDRHLTL